MRVLNFTELEDCSLSVAPPRLPQKLKEKIDTIITAFAHTKTNPYEDYFAIQSGEKRKTRIDLGKESDSWYKYLKYLNQCNKCFCVVQGDDLIKHWNRLAKKYDNYDEFFDCIVKEYCKLENYEQIAVDKKSERYKLEAKRVKLEENLGDFITRAEQVYDDFITYFKYSTISDVMKDAVEKHSYLINDSITVSEEEYSNFIKGFSSILQKLRNIKQIKEDKTMAAYAYLENPKSRKHGIDSSQARDLAKKLSVFCREHFQKANNSMIAAIVGTLYPNSNLTENDIAKQNKKILESKETIENNLKTKGYDEYKDMPLIIPKAK